jgi:hypothetical protein
MAGKAGGAGALETSHKSVQTQQNACLQRRIFKAATHTPKDWRKLVAI